MSLARSGSFKRSIHPDSVTKRPGTSMSIVPSVISMLENVHEDSEEEGRTARLPLQGNRSLDGSVLDMINPNCWNHFPRLSTTCDLPILDFSKDHSVSRIDSLKFSSDELLERYSDGHSTDEESIVNVNGTAKATPTSESVGSRAKGLRRVVFNSSAKLKRMGSRLRRVPSSLLAKSISRESTLGSHLQTESMPVTPIQQVSSLPHI